MKKKERIIELEKRNGKLARDYRISEMSRRLLIRGQRAAEHERLMAKIQIEQLEESLGECQAGRDALQRQIERDGSKLIAAIWREHAKETAVMVDDLRAELAAVKKERDNLKAYFNFLRYAV